MGRTAGPKSPAKAVPVDSRRVIIVLASLVAALAFMTVVLSLLEGQPVTLPPMESYLLSASSAWQSRASLLKTSASLRKNRWNYIIIYQSGGTAGNAADLAVGRSIGGNSAVKNADDPAAGVNFHFVVDNAHNGREQPAGYIEVGTAWREQFRTAPYCTWPYFQHHIYPPYANAIGICFIGNVNSKPCTAAQTHSLVRLVRALQRKFNIPVSRVRFQWDIAGSVTTREADFSRAFYQLLGQ